MRPIKEYFTKEKLFRIFKIVLFYAGYIFLLYLLIERIGAVYGIIAFAAIYAAFILWRGWGTYILAKQYIETLLFGKPLSRKYWKKGEFNNRPKKKFVWNKEKYIKKEEMENGGFK